MKSNFITICAALLFLSKGSVAKCGSDNPRPPSFNNEVMAVLSKAGCNTGTCHGNANGKGGLKLSLRGQAPDEDYLTLSRKSGARRIALLRPDESLLLRKPLMSIPHEGGRRFEPDSQEYRILRDWISSGLPKDADTAATLVSLSVSPAHKTIYAPEDAVSIRATATFTDGNTRDVTELSVFESSATFVSVSPDGTATFEQPGMTTVTVRYLSQQLPVRLEYVAPSPDFAFQPPASDNPIDAAVYEQLERLLLQPAQRCDDSTFLRRAYLDLTGLLPPIETTKAFLASDRPGKRAALIDQLLDSEEFTDFQALRWADLLRVEDKTLDAKGVEVFYDWIRASFAERKPLNLLAAEIIAARGSTYEVPETNFYRAIRTPALRAEATAQLFLGIRLQCAQCHNHPFDRWTQDDYYGWSSFFSRIEYEIVENKRRDKNDKNEFVGEQIVKMKDSGEAINPNTRQSVSPRFLGAGPDDGALEAKFSEGVSQFLGSLVSKQQEAPATPDRLQRLALWISDPENDRFAITQANRIWAQLMGQGIIDPIDDFRATNPPSNAALLDVIHQEFVRADFDVRALMRLIMNSNTYQASSSDSAGDTKWRSCFATTVPTRLTAEQTLDGISHVIGVPVTFGGHPSGTRAVQLKGVRNGGHRYTTPEIGDRFLKLFGKPGRLQTCDCERSNETTLAQTFEMLSGELIHSLLQKPGNRIENSLKEQLSDQDTINKFYLAAYCRLPSQKESVTCLAHISNHEDHRRALEDVVWALLNSNEFLLRH